MKIHYFFLFALFTGYLTACGEPLRLDVAVEQGRDLELTSTKQEKVQFTGVKKFEFSIEKDQLEIRADKKAFHASVSPVDITRVVPVLKGEVDSEISLTGQDLLIRSSSRRETRPTYTQNKTQSCNYTGACFTCLPTYGLNISTGQLDTETKCETRFSTNCPGSQPIEVETTDVVIYRNVELMQRGQLVARVLKKPDVRSNDKLLNVTGECGP